MMFRRVFVKQFGAMFRPFWLGVDPTAADLLTFLTDIGVVWVIRLGAIIALGAVIYRRFRK